MPPLVSTSRSIGNLFSLLPLLLLLSSAAKRRVRGKDDDDLEGKAAREEVVAREDKEDCVCGGGWEGGWEGKEERESVSKKAMNGARWKASVIAES